jgi:glycosyltransferase involved in cell wall biosynthesis
MARKQLGVCMTSVLFHPFAGGAEHQAERLATWLVQHGVPVMIITRHYDDLPFHEVYNGIEIYRMRMLKGKGLSALSFILGGVWTLLRHRKRFNIFYAHQIFSTTTVCWIGKRLLGHPLIVNLHRGGKEGDIQLLLRNPRSGQPRMERYKRDVDAFVVISNEILEETRAQGVPEEKIHMLGNAVDPDIYKPANDAEKRQMRQRLGLPLDVPLVVIVARLHEIKGHRVLLDAWAKVPEPAHLVIVGTGDLEEPLKARVSTEMPGRVTLTGKVPDPSPYLQAADAWTLPSFGEGLPVSMLEAMSSGLPVVVTAVGAMEELVHDDVNGYVVPVGDAAALATALTKITSDLEKARHLGNYNRDLILKEYTMDHVGQSYLDLMEKLVK